MKYILAIDQGTTGSTALIIDAENFKVVAKENIEYKQIYPKPGWVEHDLNDIWYSVREATLKALKNNNIDNKNIVAIGITNQRETTCAFNKKGAPLHNAIVWQDRRTSDFCTQKSKEYDSYKKMTGLPLDPYFSGTKMKWLLENSKDVQKAHKDNDLNFSTIDSYLLFKLTNGRSFKTEASNASRTLLLGLKDSDWNDELLKFFNIPKNTLPQVVNSFDHFGTTQELDFLPDGIPILCMLGDQQAALFGQAGFYEKSLKCTYGTGAFLLLNTGSNIVHSNNGLLTTIAYRHNDKNVYALEGSAYIAGAAVQWLRDNLDFFKSSSEIEAMAQKATNDELEHLLFLPFFTGIGSPYWKSEAKGAIVGLTRDSGKEQISRACLEGIALSINDSITTLAKDLGKDVGDIRVDGGASLNNYLLQIQANFSGSKIIRPKVIETTAFGVALGAKMMLDNLTLKDLENIWEEDLVISPETKLDYYKMKQDLWTKTIKNLY